MGTSYWGSCPICRLSALKQTFSFEGAYNGSSCPIIHTVPPRRWSGQVGAIGLEMVIINNIKKKNAINNRHSIGTRKSPIKKTKAVRYIHYERPNRYG